VTSRWQKANVSHNLAKCLTNGFAFVTVAQHRYGVAFKRAPVTGIPDWLSNFGADYAIKSTSIDADAVDVRFKARALPWTRHAGGVPRTSGR